MGNSFLLKDAAGRVCGYLIARSGEICCRIQEPASQSILQLCAEGKKTAFRLEESAAEQQFSFPGGRIAGAQVYAGGKLILATDWEMAPARPDEGVKAAQTESTPRAEGGAQIAPALSPADAEAPPVCGKSWECSLPQRRWPPPPCWPGAKYAHGAWREES